MRTSVLLPINLSLSLLLILSLIFFAGHSKALAQAQEDEVSGKDVANPAAGVIELNKVLVTAERVYSTASSSTIRQFDLNVRPISNAQSRLVHETEPVSEIHFTPGNPFNLQAGISFQF